MSIGTYQPAANSVAIVANDDAALIPLTRAVHAAGAEIAASGLLTDADWEFRAVGDVVIVDARDIAANTIDAALQNLAGPGAPASQLLVLVTLDNLDAVLATGLDIADIVVGGDDVELHLALATALARARATSSWSDVASEEGLRLQRLADEIARIARTLIDLPDGLVRMEAAVAQPMTDYRGGPAETIDKAGSNMITAAEVRMIIRMRRLRNRFFASDLFADPAWDMLLDLAAARIERTHVAVSSLCIAAAVPPTTALRWIKAMTDRGLMRRVADAHDARRVFIQLSDDAAAAMDHYLRAARAGGGLAV